MGPLQTCLQRVRGCASLHVCFICLSLLLLSLTRSSPCTQCREHSCNGSLQQQQLQQQGNRPVPPSFLVTPRGFCVVFSHALSAGHGTPSAALGSTAVVRGSSGTMRETRSTSSNTSWFQEDQSPLYPSPKISAAQVHRSVHAAANTQARLPRTTSLTLGAADKALQRSSTPALAIAFISGHASSVLRTGAPTVTTGSSVSSSSPQQQRQQTGATVAGRGIGAAAPHMRSAALPVLTGADTSLLRSSSNQGEYTLEGDLIEGPLQPLRGMVLLQRKDVPDTSPGGVYLASENKDRQMLAKVLAVGPGEMRQGDSTQRIPLDIKPGDWAVVSRHAYDTVKYNGKECVLVAAADILAKVKDASEEANLLPGDLIPLGDAVLVKVHKQPEKTASGLYVQGGDAQSRPLKRGVVLAVGPGRFDREGKRMAVEIKPGKNVLYPQYAQDEPDMKYGTDFYAFVKAADILAEW